mmetsp:Transcript_417/g.787  ORF Transcript_417/g.787 Transcript_417/m.787 type:complete len:659 (+) Transcript_417:99-2075(+)|eukprot:CAMPEP_0185035416 /NCGR_PEP_ID=MMETSP1103-20130426/26711_1 /TAXON_ID=36769 /ORGANISM="Paraphysomonas bandaiensis, Strain Caron Lab Isolate" /LENGTH=658 /DNA_ID=CAMNT_0027572475 /DNA_START=36 /DNA_END=2012 /DNA_ORIENTATION=+
MYSWLCLAIVSVNILAAFALDSEYVLVTGAAGFIGSNLVRKLRASGVRVLGIDNFDSYYSVALKRKRAELVRSAGAEIVEGNICDADMIRNLFTSNNFTHVVNLAARPGVRYTFIDPLSYVENNVKCYTQLLEQMRLVYAPPKVMPRFLYASSSSVYGLNKKIPYHELDPVNTPTNLYGATKRVNELIAFSYHHLFGISTVGFRFFTVYGPMGRPDIATNIFTEKILRNETITLFNDGELVRDFTYIDDIVNGLVAAIDRKADDGCIVYNLGNSEPIKSIEFLHILEGILGRKAKVVFQHSAADMPVTFANTSLAHQNLGFTAHVSVKDGLRRFVDWYKADQRTLIPCQSECKYDTDMCFSSGWDQAAEQSVSLTRECDLVVYTVLLRHTMLHALHSAPEQNPSCNIIFVHDKIFTANVREEMREKKWTGIAVGSISAFSDPHKASRLPKLSPGMFFASNVLHAIYIDADCHLTQPPNHYPLLLKGEEKYNGNEAVMVAVRHPRNHNIFDTFNEVESRFNRDPLGNQNFSFAVLRNQRAAYQAYQQSKPNLVFENVFDGSFLVHDLHASAGKEFRCAWFREYQDWSNRDQPPGAYVLSRLAYEVNTGSTGAEREWIRVSKEAAGYVRILSRDVHPVNRPEPNDAIFGKNNKFYAKKMH